MQKSAAEARNKNRSGLCFDYQPSAREVTKTAPKKGAAAKGGAAKKEAKPVEKAVSSEKPGLMELEFGKGGRGVSIELLFKFGRCIDTTKKHAWFFMVDFLFNPLKTNVARFADGWKIMFVFCLHGIWRSDVLPHTQQN